MKFALITVLFSLSALAQDSWLCSEDSSQIRGSQIVACGVGESTQEAVARRMAMDSATQEFNVVCGPQTLCGQHKYRVQPTRSTCEQEKGIWKCYRAVVYEIESELKTSVALAIPVRDLHNGMDEALKYGIGRGW